MYALAMGAFYDGETPLNTSTRRKLLWGVVALIIIVPLLVTGIYLLRQNYKRHHYITGIRRFGPHPGEHYRFTEERQDAMNEQVRISNQQAMDRQRERARLKHHSSQ